MQTLTLRDIVAKRDPDKITPNSSGGVRGCPSDYAYLYDNSSVAKCGLPERETCAKCWSRACNPFADITEKIEELQTRIVALKECFEKLCDKYNEDE